MSAAKLILGAVGTNVLESLAGEAGRALLAGFRNDDGAPSRGRSAACWRCPWRKNGQAANSRHATRGISAEVIVPGRARVAVPGLGGNPERAAAIEAVLAKVDGVSEARANHLTGRVLVLFDPAAVDLPALRRAIHGSGAGPAAPQPVVRELVAVGPRA